MSALISPDGNGEGWLMDVLAVDLGKTGCRVALWQGDVCTVGEGPGAAGLADRDGVAQAEAAILALAAGLMRGAGVDRLDRVGVGAAGAWTAPDAAATLAGRLRTSLTAAQVAVASDAVASHAGALAGEPGVVLAAGTGAVAVVVGPEGGVHRVDGFGPWLGDEGSGASIGLAGLRAALRAADGRGPATTLTEAARQRLGPLSTLPAAFASDANPARLAATFAPAVAKAAVAGDRVAQGLITDAVASLVATVRAARELLPAGRSWPFALLGGLTGLGDVLTGPLLAAVAGLSLQPVAAPGSALDGARWLTTPGARLYGDAVRYASAPTNPS